MGADENFRDVGKSQDLEQLASVSSSNKRARFPKGKKGGPGENAGRNLGVIDGEESGEDAKPKTKKPRFPKGRKGGPGDSSGRALGIIDGEDDDGPVILSTDPRVAAKERATRRDPAAERLAIEDTSVLDDVAGAEEIYEGEDEEIVEDGVRFEPFNLKQEREEGYFDAEGNYVEYRNESDSKDAWLDSVEVDTRFAGKAAMQSGEDAEGNQENLGKEELWAIKQRIANALQPGETVLRALRRLKGTSKEGNRRERMPETTKIIFDQLTEDAMKLLDDDVYEEKRETFEREAEGYAALARLRAGISNGTSAVVGESSRSKMESDGDMFSDAHDEIMDAPSNNAAVPSTGIESGSRTEKGKEQDMFGDDDDLPVDQIVDTLKTSAQNGGETHTSAQSGGVPVDGSGYMYDESSGYYYNSDVGYYYDANSGLYCSASTSQWYKFDEEQNTYKEVTQLPG